MKHLFFPGLSILAAAMCAISCTEAASRSTCDPACEAHAACVEIEGERACVCVPGYTGDGVVCLAVDGGPGPSTDAGSMTDASDATDAGPDANEDSGLDGGSLDGDAGPDAGPGPAGAPVGSPCTMANECASLTSPVCLEMLAPFADVAGVTADIAAYGLVFPDGYCSSVRDCVDDADCGAGGGCFRPFSEVTDGVLRVVESSFAPPLATGSLQFLRAYGVCLETCDSAATCQSGFACEPPLASLVAQVDGAVSTATYCVPSACPTCGAHASCNPLAGVPMCVCDAGYSGNGLVCTLDVALAPLGAACTVDAECASAPSGQMSPVCLHALYPFASATGTSAPYATLGITMANGYCSTGVQCHSNIACGAQGGCYQPFRNVVPETLRELEATFSPPLASGALDYLPDYAVCLRTCTSVLACAPDQVCDYPMQDLVNLVPGGDQSKRYCVPATGCESCNDPHAYCSSTGSGSGFCACEPGYVDLPGAGVLCAVVTDSLCAAAPCLNGGACTDHGDGTFTCACAGGYTGSVCEVFPP